MKALPHLFALLALATTAFAGEPLPAVFVTDSSSDNVWRLQDLNADGDYNDAGEIVEYYSDALGPFTLSNNNVVELGSDGTLYVGDTSNDAIYAMVDNDSDGECNDVGETRLFFDQTNASGIDMSSIADLHAAADGRLWASNANNGGGGFDGVFWMRDGNNDGDANDAGEAVLYYNITSAAVGDSNPTGLTIGPDGSVYFVENGSTGVFAKGVYRLEDVDLSGTIDQPGEAAAFFLPAAQASNPFFWDLELGTDGAFYMADTGNELIWQFQDQNVNDVIDIGTEDFIWWQGTSSLIWQLQVGRGGAIFAAESQTPDRVLRFSDDDLSATIDQPGEVVAVYDETVSPVAIGNPRGMVVDTSFYGANFCDASDGSLASCPCAPGDPDTGCDLPIPAMQGGGTTGGVKLSVVKQLTNPQNRATLMGSGFAPFSPGGGIMIRDSTIDASSPVVFGDGLRCIGMASLTRLGAAVRVGGAVTSTFGHGTMAGNGTFHYQFWFRSTPQSFCDPTAAFSLSNGQSLTW